MDSISSIQFLEGKTVLVTGVTGFLAKIFVEKVLRIQPKVKKLYLLIRATDVKSAKERFLDEVMKKDLFRVLRDKRGANLRSFILEKVVAVPGDISSENLGIKDFNVEEIWRETDVIINSAATTDFTERDEDIKRQVVFIYTKIIYPNEAHIELLRMRFDPDEKEVIFEMYNIGVGKPQTYHSRIIYDVALRINTMGTLNLTRFAEKCNNIQMLLHVSTAYVCGTRSGLIVENPLIYGETFEGKGKLDVNEENKLVEDTMKELQARDANEKEITSTMKDLGIKRARLHGWPNTYVFTKAMGEMLLGFSKGNLPVVVIRPTMVTSTYKEPFKGWVEGLRTMDAPIVGYGKGKLGCLFANPDTILDLIPADMVVNVMIMAMVANATIPSEMVIYHVGSSMRNPIKISDIQRLTHQYFTKSPLADKLGNPIKVSKGIIISSSASFHRYLAIRYIIPLKGLQWLNSILCQYFKDISADYDRKMKLVMNLVELYEPYMFFGGIFDDINVEKLRRMEINNNANVNAFCSDPKCIDWEDYIMNTHIPGLVKYVVK